MRIIPVQQTEDEYRGLKAVNQSALKCIISEPAKAKAILEGEDQDEPDKEYFTVGRLVEEKLTTGKADFEYSGDDNLSSTLKIIAKSFFNRIKMIEQTISGELTSDQEEIFLTVIEASGYNSNWGREAKLNLFKKMKGYLNLLQRAGDVPILSYEGKEQYDRAVNNIINDPNFVKYFPAVWAEHYRAYQHLGTEQIDGAKERLEELTAGLEVMYSVPVTFTMLVTGKDQEGNAIQETVMCKILVDMLVFDRIKNTYQMVDIKTTGDELDNLKRTVVKYRYDVQLSFYTSGLRKVGKVGNYNLKNMTMLEPALLVISKIKKEVFLAPMTVKTLQIAKFGSKSGNVIGWKEMLEIYLYRKITGDWYKHAFADNYQLDMYNWEEPNIPEKK